MYKITLHCHNFLFLFLINLFSLKSNLQYCGKSYKFKLLTDKHASTFEVSNLYILLYVCNKIYKIALRIQ